AEAMYEVRKYGEAVASFSKFLGYPVAKKTDVYNYAHYALAYAAFRNSQYQTSANYFELFLNNGKTIDQNTRNGAIARLADSYFSLKSYGKAMQQYDRLINSKAPSQDYALFQRGIIQGLQGDMDAKISTLTNLQEQFPNSYYADNSSFEIPYSHFLKGDYDVAIVGLQEMVEKYPRSSYVPRALVTIGLVQYNKDNDAEAIKTFERVVADYSTTDEAMQALKSNQNIYIVKGITKSYLNNALNTNFDNLSPTKQDNVTFQSANGLFVRGEKASTVEALNAYFHKFRKPIKEKYARFIR